MDLDDDNLQRFVAVKTAARPLFEEEPVTDHPLFLALREQRLSKEQARAVALDVYHVVEHFPRFLSAVLTSITDFRKRMVLVQNLYQEHGSMNLDHVHSVTYRHFLHGLGLSEAAIAAHRPGIGSVVYVRAVLALCQSEEPSQAVAALAVIEEVVARVSPIVRRWGRAQAVHGQREESHFSVHETLDLSHADELYALSADHWQLNPDKVRLGLALGMYYQRRLYSDLVEQHLR